MKTPEEGKLKIIDKKAVPKKSEEIKADFPMSEKDEVKKAEERLKESQKKNG